jgi:hypothetical protein
MARYTRKRYTPYGKRNWRTFGRDQTRFPGDLWNMINQMRIEVAQRDYRVRAGRWRTRVFRAQRERYLQLLADYWYVPWRRRFIENRMRQLGMWVPSTLGALMRVRGGRRRRQGGFVRNRIS